jgi:hypothetical protein
MSVRTIQKRLTRCFLPACVIDDLVTLGRDRYAPSLPTALLLHIVLQDAALYHFVQGDLVPRREHGDYTLIRAKLDARITKLYSLTRDELRYILGTADVYGPDFPGATFRLLKEKETRLYSEYWMRRLVLEAWDRENP